MFTVTQLLSVEMDLATKAGKVSDQLPDAAGALLSGETA